MKRLSLAALSIACLVSAACIRKSSPPARKPAGGPAIATASYSLRRGEATFRHYCQTCHGETGAGDGFNAFNLDPHPRDLSDPAFQKSKKDADFADAIRRGGAGVGLSALMPPWGHTLSERQIADVVAYLRTFRK
jgi:mono/diheme cytochrome c family protein